jgi:hypothetical protein
MCVQADGSLYSCTHWLRLAETRNPPPPTFRLTYEGAIGHWSAKIDISLWPPDVNEGFPYTIKKVNNFPVPSRDVTNQTLPDREKIN